MSKELQAVSENNLGEGRVPDNTSVTNSSTQIIAANANRQWCYIVNIGNKDVWMAIGQTALVNKGILLGKNGGSITLDVNIMTTEVINGITSAGSSTVAFQEGE